MSASTEVMKDFSTPDRAPSEGAKSAVTRKDTITDTASKGMKKPATVTPPDAASREAATSSGSHSPGPEDRHVHFDKDRSESPGSENSGNQRGVVSRRGGRYASAPPARAAAKSNAPKEAVLEFKTYRSPPRVKKETTDDAVPSLCSTKSFEKKESEQESSSLAEDKKPASISCDTAVDQTSPLGSDPDSSVNIKEEDTSRKSNVSFSPVPDKKDGDRTLVKSPTPFQSLPKLDDEAKSPGGYFLSSHPPTPSSRFPGEGDDLFGKSGSDKPAPDARIPMRSPKTPTPRSPKRDDHRFLTTPTTDFALDYGKPPNSNFESSNVLAWLHSPTANGLFSPGGGLGSLMNTPRAAMDPRTPRTPTVSTSFFFSDVAGLPRTGEEISPKPDASKKAGSGRGYSNIICISPLASSKSKNGGVGHTPTVNYKDMFASPAERSRGLPLLSDSPVKGMRARGIARSASKDPNIDAVHMAEKDLMEDEDLSVLLNLASNTPKNPSRPVAVSTSEGTHVFRSPNGRARGRDRDDNLPSLQLPIIGGRDSQSNGARLSRKTHSRDHEDAADDYHRSMSMLSHGTSGSADKGKNGKEGKSEASKKAGKNSGLHPPPPYPMAPPHPYASHPDAPYYPMPPGMPPHAGTMRVAVGVPPPVRPKPGSPARSPHGSRPYTMGPGDPNYPPPPYPPPPGHYPHHPGMPPHHMHPHYSHYPHPHHGPPRGMPMYGAHPPPGKPKGKKGMKPMKAGVKRPPPQSPKSLAKKSKKSSPGSGKKKNRSPQITDKVERQKAAATIQAVNAASGGKNDKAAALAAAILRGVTMRPSGKWQAQLYFAGKSRYIGVFDTREKAALAYEIAREKLKSEKANAEGGSLNAKQTEAAVNAARKAAFEGVNERDPRLPSK